MKLQTILVLALAFGCRTASEVNLDSSELSSQCGGMINIQKYLSNTVSCYRPGKELKDSFSSLDGRKGLYPWIPCNKVELISHASNGEWNHKSAIAEIVKTDTFAPEDFDEIIKDSSQPLEKTRNRAFISSPIHQATVKVIRSAKESIFLDAILFGGSWGNEILREIIQAKRTKGIKVFVLRDIENVFAFDKQLTPLWNSLTKWANSEKDAIAIRADIYKRPSALPFGVDKVAQTFDAFSPSGMSFTGKSDHSKVVIADGYSESPMALISSKNPSDYTLLNYDESAIVSGPAAMAIQASYLPDIILARKLAVKEIKASEEDLKDIDRWIDKLENIKKHGTARAAGDSSVRLSENNGDDSVRNVEHTVLQMIAGATENIRMYNFLTYNPHVARAIVAAQKRLGIENVRIIMDGTLTLNMNHTFVKMLTDAGAKDLDSLIKWRLTEPAYEFPKSTGRISIVQQQHIKTIIVDDKYVYLGSANFDSATFAGAFREMSIEVNEPQVAKESSTIFDRLWNDKGEATTNDQFEKMKASEIKSPSFESKFIGLLEAEGKRIRALNSENIDPEECN